MLLPAAIGMMTGMISARHSRHIAGSLCGLSAFFGTLAYPLFLYGGNIAYTFPIPSAWGSYSVLIDELSSMMISVSSIVFLAVLSHMLRSASTPAGGKYSASVCLLF
ncbi:MAG: hypothetical protein FWC29_04655, partial [Methanomassiliicoccaceae archaeon]|nr:hypothetical protein [Methanomassiliicoccaceae archaeon]